MLVSIKIQLWSWKVDVPFATETTRDLINISPEITECYVHPRGTIELIQNW